MNNKYKIEICANSVQSCIEAQRGGAYRVELCAGIPEGGTTPSYATIMLARKKINIKLHVIIRPRGGDFLYSDIEKEIMLNDIKIAKQLGADGVVVGALTADGNIDVDFCKQLISFAGGINVTFHRAFDMCKNAHEALEQLISLGFSRVLTSGQQPTAEQGVTLLKELVEQAGNRIIIMPGCGVRENNIAKIATETGAVEFHTSARSIYESQMKYRNPNVSMGGTVKIDEYLQEMTDSKNVEKIIEKLNAIN